MMETLSEAEFSPPIKKDIFIPNTFVDIIKFIDKKIQIMGFTKVKLKSILFLDQKNIKALANFEDNL